jgi:N-acetylated-alpha-linked acidic dipeptidase
MMLRIIISTIAIIFTLPVHALFAGGLPVDTVWEKRFRAVPDPVNMREYMRRLSAHPHHVGSSYDKENAEWILKQFSTWGLDAHIEEFSVLFPSPAERAVELVAPTTFSAKLQEPSLAADPTSAQQSEQLPTYNAYSADGDVTAPLVYANYGTTEDYETLEEYGISVRGAIVITRYGGAWRGVKPKLAAEHGAVGCLIYSDPSDDGYTEGDVYPKGPWRPEFGVQRGSVIDMSYYPGDPLTPEIGATEKAHRLSLQEARTITRIPVLPLSYADARPLLEALDGPVAPGPWRGTLPMTYHIGPGPARVHLKVAAHWDRKTIYDVIGMLRGSTWPDEWVIRGNHHDAWVNGAEDPISGLVPMLEEARTMGTLLKEGWKPKRTIVFCAWDGEEEGLLGSTEWAETHATELRKKAVLYVNSDGNGRGYFGAAGSQSLERFVNGVVSDIVDPETGLSVKARSRLRRIASAPAGEKRTKARGLSSNPIGALGSGSDYTAFLDFLGVSSLNVGYGGEDGGGIYHSIYDSFSWYTRFSDTSFVYGRALAQTAGTMVMRYADAAVLPLSFPELHAAIATYADEVETLAANRRAAVLEKNALIREGAYAATADPRRPKTIPAIRPVPPYLNFAPLKNACSLLAEATTRATAASDSFATSGRPVPPGLNGLLMRSERAFTTPGGITGRPWFKHQVYAPGAYSGYGVKTLPAIREAIEQERWPDAEEAVLRTADVLRRETAVIDSIAATYEKAMR